MSKLFKLWKRFLTSDKEDKIDFGTIEWNLPTLAKSRISTNRLRFILILLVTKNLKREFKKMSKKDSDKKKSKTKKKEESLECSKNNEIVFKITIKKNSDSKQRFFY